MLSFYFAGKMPIASITRCRLARAALAQKRSLTSCRGNMRQTACSTASFRTYSRRCRAFFWPLKNSETTRRDATCVPSRLTRPTGSRLLHSGKCAVVASVLGCLVSKASCGFYEAHPEMYYGSADLRNFELFRAGISAHVSIWTQASNKCLTWECWQVGFFVSLLLRWASRFHGFGVQHSSDSMNYTVSQPSSTCRSGRRHHWRLRGQSAH